MFLRPIWLLAAIVVAAVTTRAAQAQDSAATRTATSGSATTLDGVYSSEQADKGAQTYKKNCVGCHAPMAYTGLAFKRVWTGRSIYDLFTLIRTTMPNDKPGKLSRGQYADILAYLLRLNGLPPGDQKLSDEDDALKQITIEVAK